MTKERKILLALFIPLTLIFLIQIFWLPVVRENRSIRERIGLINKKLNRAKPQSEKEPDSEGFEEYKTMLKGFAPGIKIYDLGREIKEMVLENSLILKSYSQGSTREGGFFEYSAEGNITNIIDLIRKMETGLPYIEFSRLSIDSASDPAGLNMRVSPAEPPGNTAPVEIETTGVKESITYQYTPKEISTLFVHHYVPVKRVQKKTEPVEKEPEPDPVIRDRLEFIGIVETEESGIKYYLKDTVTGRILKVPQEGEWQNWKVKKVDENRITLINSEKVYEVKR